MRLVAIAMTVLHLILGLMSLINFASLSTLDSESKSCKIIYPLNHLMFFGLNMALLIFFLSTIIATSSTNLSFFEKSKILLAVLGMFVVYTILVKLTSNVVCQFWTMQWIHIIPMSLFGLCEGFLVSYLFNWYVSKSSKVRDQMQRCIERIYSKKA